MKSERSAELFARFEAIARVERGVEYWLARDLQPLLEYERWENFATLIERARSACANAGQPVGDQFRDLT
jgi:DNA-damage-inducible protein D